MISSLSPLDGRYAEQMEGLREFFSEKALIRARLFVEVSYLIALGEEKGVRELPRFTRQQKAALWAIVETFNAAAAAQVKAIEAVTRHDVKAVEKYLAKKIGAMRGLSHAVPFIHFGLTSEDVNNLAYGMLIHRALQEVLSPSFCTFMEKLNALADATKDVQMLSLTHGQPATPSTLGKEMMVFVGRLYRQLTPLSKFQMQGKLGGAVGNFSAHKAAYPAVAWEKFRVTFVKSLGLTPLEHTTQINPHDDLAELSHFLFRINTILIGFSRDIWMYISRGVFIQKVVKGEVGSSTMPHKVNPIDFENAEGNLGLSNALFAHFAEKLPISRLQRDLSDSTVQRNIGVAFGHHLLAVQSLIKGLGKLSVDRAHITHELDMHPEVLAEVVQTMLRKHGDAEAYDTLKAFTRGKAVTRDGLLAFVQTLNIPRAEKQQLEKLFRN